MLLCLWALPHLFDSLLDSDARRQANQCVPYEHGKQQRVTYPTLLRFSQVDNDDLGGALRQFQKMEGLPTTGLMTARTSLARAAYSCK